MNLTSSETASAETNSVNGDEEKASTTSCSARVNADSSLAKSSSLVKSLVDPMQRQHKDKKVVGLAEGVRRSQYNGDIPLEDDEKYSREKVEQRPIVLAIVGYYTALKIFVFYLISINSLITVGASVGLTIYWHERFKNDTEGNLSEGMDWILLGFAVITPLSLSAGMAFKRRERALIEIGKWLERINFPIKKGHTRREIGSHSMQ